MTNMNSIRTKYEQLSDYVTPGLLTFLKARYGAASDYAISQMLGISRTTISHWRRGRSGADLATVLKMAYLADLDIKEVLLEWAATRETDPELRRHLLDLIYAPGRKPLFFPELKKLRSQN